MRGASGEARSGVSPDGVARVSDASQHLEGQSSRVGGTTGDRQALKPFRSHEMSACGVTVLGGWMTHVRVLPIFHGARRQARVLHSSGL